MHQDLLRNHIEWSTQVSLQYLMHSSHPDKALLLHAEEAETHAQIDPFGPLDAACDYSLQPAQPPSEKLLRFLLGL